MNKFLKNIVLSLTITIGLFSTYNQISYARDVDAPEVNCIGLPGCEDTSKSNPKAIVTIDEKGNLVTRFLSNTVGTLIGYTTAIGVIALMFSGFIYMTSGGDEEKANKAKRWITWILVGVIASLLAYTAINIIDNLVFDVNPDSKSGGSEQPAAT